MRQGQYSDNFVGGPKYLHVHSLSPIISHQLSVYQERRRGLIDAFSKAIEMEDYPARQKEFLQRDRRCIKKGQNNDYIYIYIRFSCLRFHKRSRLGPGPFSRQGEICVTAKILRIGTCCTVAFAVQSEIQPIRIRLRYIWPCSALKPLPPSPLSTRAPTPAVDALPAHRLTEDNGQKCIR